MSAFFICSSRFSTPLLLFLPSFETLPTIEQPGRTPARCPPNPRAVKLRNKMWLDWLEYRSAPYPWPWAVKAGSLPRAFHLFIRQLKPSAINIRLPLLKSARCRSWLALSCPITAPSLTLYAPRYANPCRPQGNRYFCGIANSRRVPYWQPAAS